jgi:hypothetical protein
MHLDIEYSERHGWLHCIATSGKGSEHEKRHGYAVDMTGMSLEKAKAGAESFLTSFFTK